MRPLPLLQRPRLAAKAGAAEIDSARPTDWLPGHLSSPKPPLEVVHNLGPLKLGVCCLAIPTRLAWGSPQFGRLSASEVRKMRASSPRNDRANFRMDVAACRGASSQELADASARASWRASGRTPRPQACAVALGGRPLYRRWEKPRGVKSSLVRFPSGTMGEAPLRSESGTAVTTKQVSRPEDPSDLQLAKSTTGARRLSVLDGWQRHALSLLLVVSMKEGRLSSSGSSRCG